MSIVKKKKKRQGITNDPRDNMFDTVSVFYWTPEEVILDVMGNSIVINGEGIESVTVNGETFTETDSEG